MALYKYMKSEHAEMFFRNGTLRIGTLFDFKKNENFNEAVGDKHEGSHYPYMDVVEPIYSGNMNSLQKSFLKGAISLAPGASISNLKIVREVTSSDFFVFCMTTEPSRDAMEEFECDICIEIADPTSFIKALTRKVKSKTGDLAWHGHVTYMRKDYPYMKETGLHPACTKDERYMYQKEYRAIWHARKNSSECVILSPLFIKAPKLIKYCREIRL